MCVFLQDICFDTWVMGWPWGGGGGGWGGRGHKFNFCEHGNVAYQIDGDDEVKRSNIIKFQLQSQFQRFLYQTICVFSQIKYIIYILDRIFILLPGSCPRVGLGDAGESKT